MTSEATSVALALRDEPQAVMLTPQQIQVIANTEFVPKSMRGNVPKVLACVARGRAMGIPDMVALNGIDIIDGKATLSAELMCAIVREHRHSITGEVNGERAVVRGKRRDNGDTMTAEFNVQMAETAGLLNKANWKRHPDDMMWARAVSKLCRRLFADCFAGGTYAPEDMVTADEIVDEAEWVPGAVQEAGSAAPSGDIGTPATRGAGEPSTAASDVAPASSTVPTTWGQLVEQADRIGVSLNELKGKRNELFPDAVKPSDLSAADVGVVWGDIVEQQQELV